MKIMMIGNDPHEVGGVANYTRPLAQKLVELGNDVNYFYSGSYNLEYDWRLKPYLKINRTDFPFEYAGIINSPCWKTNFGNPDIDIFDTKTEALFSAYLDRVKPDVVHMHSRVGLPASIVKSAAVRGIPIINTIHVYGFLCQKRVMIDHHGDLCEGPTDLVKCSRCTGKLNIRKQKFNVRVKKTSRTVFNCLVIAKHLLVGGPVDRSGGNVHTADCLPVDSVLVEGLTRRLNYMIGLMNSVITKTICVSEDVKNTMMRFGVHEDRLIVQHIGSLIAEDQALKKKQNHHPIVIGNIGGVHYYKGTHILIDAVSKMRNHGFLVKIFGKYDDTYKNSLMAGKNGLPVEFIGRYVPTQLPEILEQIDVMVLPSICNDTAPQTIFESYSRHIPIVASNIGGFPEFIVDGVNGRLFRPGDSNDLAEVLDDLVSNPSKIISYLEHIPKLKTIKKNANELLSLYDSIKMNAR